MANRDSGKYSPQAEKLRRTDPQLYARLKAESKAPYRGLRKFIYIAFGASGAIGAFIFLMQLIAGKGEFGTTLSNLGVQIGVIALMVFLFRLEKKE